MKLVEYASAPRRCPALLEALEVDIASDGGTLAPYPQEVRR